MMQIWYHSQNHNGITLIPGNYCSRFWSEERFSVTAAEMPIKIWAIDNYTEVVIILETKNNFSIQEPEMMVSVVMTKRFQLTFVSQWQAQLHYYFDVV